MDWLWDYLAFCAHNGFGGIALLLATGLGIVIALGLTAGVIRAVFRGLGAAGGAFRDGWRQSDHKDA